MEVSILGVKYAVLVKKYDEDGTFARDSIDGYCDSYAREIVVCDLATHANWKCERVETTVRAQDRVLRHEIVHAFLSESGLDENSFGVDGPWARNEEMVDWFAIQGPKIYRAWRDAGCL